MMDNSIFSWLIVAELILPFVVISIFLAMALLQFKKRNKKAAKQLVLAIKESESRDRDAIFKFLREKVGLSEEQAKKTTIKVNNERKFLFRNLVASLLNQKIANLAQLNDDLYRLLEIYHQLDFEAGVIELEDESDKDEQIAALQAEVKSLKYEVHVTLTTLNNIFAEFSSMFGEEVPNREMSVDQIITAMESFAGKGQVAEGAPPAAEPVDDKLEEPEPQIDEEAHDEAVDIDHESEIEAELDAEIEVDVEPTADDESENVDEAEDAAELAVMASKAMADDSEDLDESIDAELDAIDSALDELELGSIDGEESSPDDAADDEEPTWDDAFEEAGQKKQGDND